MYLINHELFKLFKAKNKLSAFRLLTFVSNTYNNHLHTSDFKEISYQLKISHETIKNNIRVLIKLGYITNHAKDYYRFKSWKTITNSNNTRYTKIDLSTLRDISKLKLSIMKSLLTKAVKVGKYFARKARTKGQAFRDQQDCSYSFFQAIVGRRTFNPNYFYKNLRTLESMKLIEVFRSKTIIASFSNFKDAFVCSNYHDNSRIELLNSKYILYTNNINKIKII